MAKIKLSDTAILNAKSIITEGKRILMRDYPLYFSDETECRVVITKVISSLVNDGRPPTHSNANIQAVLESIWMDMMDVLDTPESRKEFQGFYDLQDSNF